MKRITNKYLAKAIILGVGVLSAASLTASAQVLFTTQNDFTPWTGSGSVAAGAAGDADLSTINGLGDLGAPGGTGTAGALGISGQSIGWNPAQSQSEQNNAAFIAALWNNNELSLTYTLTESMTTAPNGYWQLVPVFNNNQGYTGLNNANFFSVANGTLLAGTYTVTYSYTPSSLILPTAAGQDSYFQLLVVANSGGSLVGGNQQYYIDNIQVSTVPEPASFALAGLGAAALLIFRRRK
jgi:PEP-CTERM motif